MDCNAHKDLEAEGKLGDDKGYVSKDVSYTHRGV